MLVIFYLLVLSANGWIYPSDWLQSFSTVPATFLFFIQDWLETPSWNQLLFFLLILGQAYYLNFLVGAYKITRQYTNVPAICFLLLHFVHLDGDIATPIIFANTFLLGALHCVLDAYSKKASLGTIFNIGFWIGVAALFYSSYMVYIVWGIIALLVVRTFDLQEFILIILGYLIPFFLAGTWHYALDDFQQWWLVDIWGRNQAVSYSFDWNMQIWTMIGLLLLPYLLAILNLGGLQFKTTTKEKKYIYVLLLLPVVGLLTFLVQSNIPGYHFYTFIVPIGILFGLVTQSYKNALWAELLHLLIFMTCMGIQYQNFFFQ